MKYEHGGMLPEFCSRERYHFAVRNRGMFRAGRFEPDHGVHDGARDSAFRRELKQDEKRSGKHPGHERERGSRALRPVQGRYGNGRSESDQNRGGKESGLCNRRIGPRGPNGAQ